MDYIYEITLKSESSNLYFPDFKIGCWRGKWENNTIIALTKRHTSLKNVDKLGDSFEFLDTPDRLGLLIDVLSFCTDLPVSANKEYLLFKEEENQKIQLTKTNEPFNYIYSKVHSLKLMQRGTSSDDWPIRLSPGVSYTFKNEKIAIIKYLFKTLEKMNFDAVSIKLLNYWRRGFDLDKLCYWDESFLAFFKILEYFEKKYTRGKDKTLDRKIQLAKYKTTKKALKIIGGAGRSYTNKYLIKLITNFIDCRNKYDIAHLRIYPLPKRRESSFYFTYYFDVWDLHDDIKEMARLFILHRLGVNNVYLKNDGGLLKMGVEKHT